MQDPRLIDVVTPLSLILRDIARSHDPVQLRLDQGALRAAQYLNIELLRRGLVIDSIYRVRS